MRRIWLLAFLAFFAIGASWAVTDPLGGPIDEPQHMIWAAAVTDGQFSGPTFKQEVVWGNALYQVHTDVRVPEEVVRLDTEFLCFARNMRATPKCEGRLNHDSTDLVPYSTMMGSYNPLYYLLVGWPVHVVPGLKGLYAMRLISALLCAALLACAATTALRVGRVAFCGVLAAATPSVLFLTGSVNPNGPEAAGGLLAFAALSALALDHRPEYTRSRLWNFALGAGVVAIVRPVGLEWLLGLLVIGVIMIGARRSLDLVRAREAWRPLGALGAAALYAAVWNFTLGGLNTTKTAKFNGYTLYDSLRDSFNTTSAYLQEMIGITGWNENPAPWGAVVGWVCLIAVLTLAAAMLADRRELTVLGLVLAGIVFIPILANASQAKGLVNLWEGRYLMWWAVGLPVYAATLLAVRLDRLPATTDRRLPLFVFGVATLAQLGVYWLVVRRYGTGLDAGSKASSSLLPSHLAWSPPVGWTPGMALLLIGLALTGTLLSWPRWLPDERGRGGCCAFWPAWSRPGVE